MNPYSPPDEDSAALFNERTLYAAPIVNGVLYGIAFAIFALTFRRLLTEPKKSCTTYALILYTSSSFILSTIFLASSAVNVQLTFIDDRNFPGGPNAFTIAEYSITVNLLCNACAILLGLLADGLLLWRGLIIYTGSWWRWVMLFPAVIYLGSWATGIGLLIQVSRPTLNIWSSLNFSLPFFTFSLFHNIIITLMIALRLLIQRRHISETLGYKHAQQYISIVAIVVESAAIFSITYITLLGLYLSNNSVQNVYLKILPQIEFLGPLLLIYRVAEGRAWSSKTLSHSEATPRYAPNNAFVNTHPTDVNRDRVETPSSSINVAQKI